MRHSIDHRLKDRLHCVLRHILPPEILHCGNFHIFRHKVAGFGNLYIQRSADIPCVRLIGCIPFFASITDSLNKGVGNILFRLSGCHEYPADTREYPAVFVLGEQFELQ